VKATMTITKALALLALAGSLGCATVAEQRKLEYEVNKMRSGGTAASEQGKRIAELSAELDAMRAEIAELRGRVEQAEHSAKQATDDARAAREASAQQPEPTPEAEDPSLEGADAAELALYREGFDAWRTNDHPTCIDRFERFLQAYASSKLADDAAFWWADCHYKAGDLQKAVLRFSQMVERFPESEKAPEALFRSGETLLQLGPKFSGAAKKAFQRVIDEYPDHKRAQDARDRLAIIPG
jgi:tol-pal system protein YbgF